MEELLNQQNVVMRFVERSLDNLKKVGKSNFTLSIIRNRLQQMQHSFSQCQNLHGRIMAIATKEARETHSYFTQDRFSVCEETFLASSDYMTKWQTKLESKATTHPQSAISSQPDQPITTRSTFQLPRINLPKFSGEFSEWEAFRDQFTSLIINNADLLDVNRLQYLISCVKGEASDVIRNLTLTDSNFKVAWTLLKSRYDNQRRLVHEHIHVLITLPQASSDSAVSLTALRDKSKIAVLALKNLGRSVDTWDDIMVYLIVQKFDKTTRKAWELQFGDTDQYPSYELLEQFLASRIRALENLAPTGTKLKRNPVSIQSHLAKTIKCPLCQKTHYLSACQEFQRKTCDQRRELVKQLHCCFNCLSSCHQRNDCKSKHTCRHCQQNHHTLLHLNQNINSNTDNSDTVKTTKCEDNETVNSHLLANTSFSKCGILLATAWIQVSGSSGRKTTVHALLDQGSVTTIITERLVQRLRLPRTHVSVSIVGVGETVSQARHAAQINITSRIDKGPVLSVNVLVLKSLTSYAPSRSHCITDLTYLHNLELADPDPTSSYPIDIIVGADLYSSILLPGIHKRSQHEPLAQNSIFGWLLSGPIPSNIPSVVASIPIHHCTVNEDFNNQLKRFWEIEDVPHQTHLSLEEKRCEEHFLSTHSRSATGQYIVRLPFKTNPPLNIGESKPSVLAMQLRLESRLKSQPHIYEEYNAFLAEYERLGHMAKVQTQNKYKDQSIYLPHHAVIRDSSTTTHLRVVFNGLHPTSNGQSLNDHLLIGPKLQVELPSILMRWRLFRYVYTADITKMYRQILVHPFDTDYQRIIWRPSVDSSVQDYKLLTVTYGTASAPYLALRVLQQLATDEGSEYPLAVPILRQHTYVDDCVFGADDIPLALSTKEQLTSLLSKAGFQLHKWASNTPVLLEGIDPTDHGLTSQKTLQVDDHVKVLGIKWNPSNDAFQFEVKLPDSFPTTKRSILSTIAKFFDPLGLLTPVVILAKIIMQQLWLHRYNWDDIIDDDIRIKWQDYYSELECLRDFSIPRWTGHGSDTIAIELHGFADASTSAYGAVVYLKLIKIDGSTDITLLTAKSKVAPLKPMSIPRLELCATVLLARTLTFTQTTLDLKQANCHCWTDSTVALTWLNQSSSRWKIFVANRVHYVQTQLPYAVWRYVPSKENPADLASRGVKPSNLKTQALWWEGPAWLKLSSDQWPQTPQIKSAESCLEDRNQLSMHVTQYINNWDLAMKFSSWPKLLRVTAYVIKFTQQLRKHVRSSSKGDIKNKTFNSSSLFLLPSEIQNAREFWIKTIQQQLFPKEYSSLSKKVNIQKNSKLKSLNPFIDEQGLIRIRGRLQNADLPAKTKTPIVLGAHPLVSLLIQATHLRALHSGPQLTLCLLQEEFWILRARQTIRATLYRCVVCARERAQVQNELMGDLPECRVRPSIRAFLHCGIDYAGPIQVRSNPGRGHTSRKAYIAVFVCMTVKAIHLELVSDLSTAAFLASFDRFCARRGTPSHVYTDNATNFQGAQRELINAWHNTTRDPNVINQLVERGVQWNFIPPASPHFDGLWEASVKSVKYHTKRVIGSHTLTCEEMNTLLCKIEACLNSRPLSQFSDNYDDYSALTPGHFLIGTALYTIPNSSLLEQKETRLTRWQLLNQMRDGFWKAWSNDYLHTLQQRPKWREVQRLAQVGRLVLLRNSLTPPSNWEMGRIVDCQPGNDGLIRVVTIQTARSTYKRSIAKLCFLPVDLNNQADQSKMDDDQ